MKYSERGIGTAILCCVAVVCLQSNNVVFIVHGYMQIYIYIYIAESYEQMYDKRFCTLCMFSFLYIAIMAG